MLGAKAHDMPSGKGCKSRCGNAGVAEFAAPAARTCGKNEEQNGSNDPNDPERLNL
jgi:hypothetical protein